MGTYIDPFPASATINQPLPNTRPIISVHGALPEDRLDMGLFPRGPFAPSFPTVDYFTIGCGHCLWGLKYSNIKGKSEFLDICMDINKFMEGRERHIELKDTDPIMFARCLQYLHTERYDCYYGLVPHIPSCDCQQCKPNNLKYLLYGNTDRGNSYALDSRDWSDQPTYVVNKEEAQKKDQAMSFRVQSLIMYQLAGRYLIPTLQDKIRKELPDSLKPVMDRRQRAPYQAVYEVVSGAFTERSQVDEKLKKVLARLLAIDYRNLRRGIDAAAVWVREWMREDDTLDLLIMDHFAGIKEEGLEQ